MNWKDTVMSRKIYEGDNAYEERVEQAETSFKAGYNARLEDAREAVKVYTEDIKKAGIKEVVEWLKEYAIHGGKIPLTEVLEDLKTHSPYGGTDGS